MALIVSPSFWGSLNAAQKTAFTEAAKKGALASRAFVDSVEKKGVEEAKANGMKVVEKVDQTAFRTALEPAYKEYAKVRPENPGLHHCRQVSPQQANRVCCFPSHRARPAFARLRSRMDLRQFLPMMKQPSTS